MWHADLCLTGPSSEARLLRVRQMWQCWSVLQGHLILLPTLPTGQGQTWKTCQESLLVLFWLFLPLKSQLVRSAFTPCMCLLRNPPFLACLDPRLLLCGYNQTLSLQKLAKQLLLEVLTFLPTVTNGTSNFHFTGGMCKEKMLKRKHFCFLFFFFKLLLTQGLSM